MKKILALFFVCILVPLALGVASQGCNATQCDDLSERCALCLDENYRTSCEQAVSQRNESLCALQLRTFEVFCLGSGGGDVGGGSNNGNCTGNETLCNGECVDLQANGNYCGSCLTQCADPTPFCFEGSCVASCDSPLTLCNDNGCVDTGSDPNNCGSCGTVCTGDGGAPPIKCENGQCVGECDTAAGLTDCDNSCVDLQTDTSNCGTCGVQCLSSQVCSAGSCASTCASDQLLCNGVCTSVSNDPNNCGSCGNVCPDDPASPNNDKCSSGVCVSTCPDGTADACGLTCIDTDSNPGACGASCENCGPNAICASGTCDCVDDDGDGSPAHCPPLGCVDISSDLANCGGCGLACLPGQVCSNSIGAGGAGGGTPMVMANCACENGQTPCPVTGCTDTNTDPSNCGACGMACQATEVCNNGTCAPDCDAGLVNCSGSCVDLDTNLNFCGSCTNNCDDNSVCTVDACNSGQCSNVSGAGICNDGNPCTQDMCDAQAGCTNTPYSLSEWAALCAQLAGLNPGPNDCVACNPAASSDAAACFAESVDDGIACTDDVCPTTLQGTPGSLLTVHTDNCTSPQTCDMTTGMCVP